MRRIRYSVAISLDGYIAGPKGEADWILMDPEIDFKELFEQFDTILVGRRTFEPMAGKGAMPGVKTIVFSRTLKPEDHPKVTVVGDEFREVLDSLLRQEGKDIWIFGGGVLFRTLVEAGLVDTVEVAVIPVLLGEGIPLLSGPFGEIKLKLSNHRVYSKTGTVWLEYSVVR